MQGGTSLPGRAVAGSEADDDGGWQLNGWRLCDDPPLFLSVVFSLSLSLSLFVTLSVFF